MRRSRWRAPRGSCAAVVRHGTFVERLTIASSLVGLARSRAAVVRHGTFVERSDASTTGTAIRTRVPLSSDTAHSLSDHHICKGSAERVGRAAVVRHGTFFERSSRSSVARARLAGAAVVRHGTFVERALSRSVGVQSGRGCRCRQTRHIR